MVECVKTNYEEYEVFDSVTRTEYDVCRSRMLTNKFKLN